MRRFAKFAVFATLAAVMVAGLLNVNRLHVLQPAFGASSLAGSTPAPAFPDGLDWINTGGHAVSLDELRGKVVILDFWTYGCINCFHIIPDLQKLEAKYGDALVVVGVHSAKFKHEQKTANIRQVALRYGRTEPIVNDRNFTIWNDYGVHAWPTVVIIDPAGNAVGKIPGEGNYALMDRYVGGLIKEFKDKHELDTRPLPFLGKVDMPDTPLLFPGKVLADGADDRLFIADSNHNRIVVTSLDGEVQAVIGNGKQGLADGDYADAEFHQPQGLALADRNTLYVADTRNNAIRKVDLKAQRVSTIAGDGQQHYMTSSEYTAEGTELNSPWDVYWYGGRLFIAMAGQHQLWTYLPASGKLHRFAGTGREGLNDGALGNAWFAQPSGLALHDDVLYVADPEASAIRAVDLQGNRVRTLVGTGLFDFGDRDGRGDDVLLQHALGVAWLGDRLYIADTYNSKLKRLAPSSRTVDTVKLQNGSLDEPGGLSAARGKLYIADTNQHAIKVYNPDSGKLQALTLSDPQHLLR